MLIIKWLSLSFAALLYSALLCWLDVAKYVFLCQLPFLGFARMSLGTCSFLFVCYSKCHWSLFVIPMTITLTKTFTQVPAVGFSLLSFGTSRTSLIAPSQMHQHERAMAFPQRFSPGCKLCSPPDCFASISQMPANPSSSVSFNSVGSEILGFAILPFFPPTLGVVDAPSIY